MNKLFYDIVIATVVASVPLFFVELKCRWTAIRSKGPYALLGAVLLGVWSVIVYGSFVEPRLLNEQREQIVLGDGSQRISVAYISDTHLGRYRHHDWMDKLVDRINAMDVDVVLLLGDIVDSPTGLRDLAPLGRVEATYGMYAALGNWDYRAGAVSVRHGIENYGEVLTNESILLGDSGVRLVGIDDLWYGSPNWDSAFSEVDEEDTVILLSHNPDGVQQGEFYGADLVVSGHTHGGQIRLPFVGPVVELPDNLGRRFDKGLFDFGATKLFITSGAGESGPRARLLDPPEIVRLDIAY